MSMQVEPPSPVHQQPHQHQHHHHHHHSMNPPSSWVVSAAAPSLSSSPSSSANASSHVVPFGAIPGSQPGALSFGFGLSAASHMSSHSQQQPPATATGGWGHAASASASAAWGQAPTTQHQQQQAALRSNNPAPTPASPAVAVSSRRRRRRSLSMDDDEAQDASMDQHIRSSPRTIAAAPPFSTRGIKKARVASTSIAQATTGPTTADLGKALASLSKESLLSLLNQLVSTSPQLVPTIEALLPPPTLSHSIEMIHHLERAVVAALPGGQNLRDEYVFGRVRVPLEQFVAESKSFLASFCSPTPRVSSTSTSSDDEIGHPSTTFAFLFALTSSLRRLELALPSTRSQVLSTTSDPMNPIASHLLPLTVNQWHVWLTRLSTGVNHEGRMLAATTLRTWFSKLEELCVDSPGVGLVGGRGEGVAKRAMEGVRERLRKEVGWVIGWREGVGAGMEADGRGIETEEEEL
ncbi:BQ5605_C004g03033 [Microbotryum silenes-dioicae]|uniref:Tethering factor for nuclear proteasome STS1 n=1 Tax=Microbotryum silenes-dioicae TaxID=796604 RepID=A0A2X0M9M6_9BASI|nr:BQ5605_C004g03033 [Microbotryum silenes-dioicae]